MTQKTRPVAFLLCVNNKGYPASLEMRKIYQAIPDDLAASRNLVRVIDESGEDYLYPANRFVLVELPRAAMTAFANAS